MKENFGVIIQGPVHSYGSGGKNDNPEGFNSIETIKENLSTLKKFVPMENIVLSGWDTDETIEDLEITQYKSKDPYSFDYLNQKRQFYTIKKGFSLLHTNEKIEYFIKIRTDQSIPLIFWEWITEIEEELNEKILVSEFYNNSPYAFGDFVICSSRKKFLDFINSQSLFRLSINGSRNMVLKYLKITTNNMANRFTKNYLINDIKFFLKFDFMFKKWSDSFRNEFFSIPINIFKKIVWRGKTMEDRFEDLEEIFSFKNNQSENYTFRSIRAEYNRYWNFIKIYFKKKLKKILKS